MRMPRPLLALGVAPVLFLALACAPVDSSTTADSTTSDSSTSSGSASGSPSADPAACAADATLTPGTLTVGTDSPAYDPWFSQDDPTNGDGFESAVAYAVADRLGFTGDAVQWTKVPFNASFAPGKQGGFDFDINQISITAQRAQVVDFSDGYYAAAQGVVTLAGSPADGATSFADLKSVKLGAQTGTTALTAIRELIQPDSDPTVFKDTAGATLALKQGQVDAIVVDLPTAFYIVAAELSKGTIAGQFQAESGKPEEFGMLFEKGSPLVACVNAALAELRDDGTLAQLEEQWLSQVADVPVLAP